MGKPVEKSLKLQVGEEVKTILKERVKKRLVTQPVKKVFDLIAPELTLVLNIFFICEIFYQQNCLIGDI